MAGRLLSLQGVMLAAMGWVPVGDGEVTGPERAFERLVSACGVPVRGPHGVAGRTGPFGECWANAWRVAQSSTRLQYCEGFYVAPTDWVIGGRRHVGMRRYHHGFVVDRRSRRVVEATAGWDRDDALYVAVPLAHEVVAGLFGRLERAGVPLTSFVETAVAFDAVDGAAQVAAAMRGAVAVRDLLVAETMPAR